MSTFGPSGAQYPNPSPHMYPVYSGPGAFYPPEANVRPVWEGGGPEYVPTPRYAEEPERPVQPEPIISSNETYESWDEAWYPSGPRSLAKAAREAGWEARIGFSRGYVPGQSKDSWEVRDIIGVWLNGYGRRAVATWERNPEAEFSAKKLEAGNIKPGEIPSGMAWSSSGTAIMVAKGRSWPYANLTDLKEWVALHGAVLPSWYTMIQAWVQAHEERDVRKAKDKPTKTKERSHA
jgi:hypothetical protein